jgi:hypothetical protein
MLLLRLGRKKSPRDRKKADDLNVQAQRGIKMSLDVVHCLSAGYFDS